MLSAAMPVHWRPPSRWPAAGWLPPQLTRLLSATRRIHQDPVQVLHEQHENVGVAVLNRPRALNSLNTNMVRGTLRCLGPAGAGVTFVGGRLDF